MNRSKAVGHLGVPGSYSHTAAARYYPTAPLLGYESFDDIFDALKKGKIVAGVLPIENTLAGSIYENYDLIEKNNIPIIGEIHLHIVHSLVVAPANYDRFLKDPKQLKTVYSHPKAIEQCRSVLSTMPWVKTQSYSDTAGAAKYVSEHPDEPCAAISSAEVEKLYNLKILRTHIESDVQNFTRFVIVGQDEAPRKDRINKCSILMYLSHEPGSLYRALGCLADNNCNVMKIESRPLVGRPFEYIFYFDFIYHAESHDIDQITKSLKKEATKVKVLGLYEASSTTEASLK